MLILGVSGSLRRASTNTAMLRTLALLVRPPLHMEIRARLDELPHFNPDSEVDASSDSVRDWRDQIRRSDAILFACPEYGHGIPGTLKNALDWIVGSGELSQRPVAITNAYTDRGRGYRARAILAQTLSAMDAIVVEPPTGSRNGLVKELLDALVGAAENARVR